MSEKIASLELELKSNSEGAVDGLEKLADTLGKLKNSTKGLGLGSVAKQLGKIRDATNVSSTSVSNLEGLAKAMQLLSGIKISASVGNQLSKINEALSKLNVGDGETKIQELVTALKPLETLGKNSLGSTANALNKLPEALSKIDMRELHGQIDALTRIMRPLAVEMEKIANGFKAFPSRIQKLITSNEKLQTSNKKTSLSFVNLLAKFTATFMALKKGVSTIMGFIKQSSTYTENMNLFTVAMGQYADGAKEYAERVDGLMGIDPGEWARSQGVFMTLATGFGVAGERASVMSQQLTQLGYDISSFYNISVEDAMTKLQSGLSGELEPLRRLGYDLSQAKLEATALSLGIDKSVSSMTQAEKAQLRYHAILNQVTTSHGDMARTIASPANQLRILKAQVEQAGRAIGNVFIPVLTKILPYLSAFFQTIKSIADLIASLVGYEPPEFDTSGMEGLTSGTEEVTEGLDKATEAAKKLKSYTMGFDELNVINPDSGDSDELSDALGDDGFEFDLTTYDFLKNLEDSPIAKITEKMKEWLGITDEVDTWSELMDTRFGSILETVGLIATGILGWKVATGLVSIVNSLLHLSALGSITLGLTLAFTGFIIEFKGIEDAIKNGLDGFNFGEILAGGLLGVGGSATLGVGIGKFIATVFKGSAVAKAITAGGGAISTGLIGAAIGGIVAGIPMFVAGVYDAIKNGLDLLSGLLIPAGSTMASAGIGAIIGMLGGPIGAGIGALIGLAIGLVTDLVILIVQNWESVSTFFTNLWTSISEMWSPVAEWFNTNVITPVVEFFKGLWDKIVEIWSPVSTWFNDNVITPIANFFEGLTTRMGQFFEGCWIIIQAVWVIVSGWFSEHVVEPVKSLFKKACDRIKTYFSNLWEGIKLLWSSPETWFSEKVVEPVKSLFKNGNERIKTYFSNAWTDIKTAWSPVTTWFSEKIITPLKDTFSPCCKEIGGFFSTLWSDIKTAWLPVSTWFTDKVITPAQTAFETCCKNIGGFFTTLWGGITIGLATAMNSVIEGIENTINLISRGINKLIKGFNDVVSWAADIIGEDWGSVTLIPEVTLQRITVPKYEDGGFPEKGQLFIANEGAGAEMVGSIGRRTAVANNDQIVAGIANGVAEANSEQNALLREQNQLLRALLNKDTNVTIDGRKVTKQLDRAYRERGATIITGGAY